MATIYSDNFNQPDGPLGGSWTVLTGGFNYHTNGLRNGISTTSRAVHSGCTSYPDVSVQFIRRTSVYSTRWWGAILRSNATAADCYEFRYLAAGTVGASHIQIVKRVGGGDTILVDQYNVPANGADHTCIFAVSGSNLSATIDGTVYATASDGDIATGEYAGVWSYNTACDIDDYLCSGTISGMLSVYPTHVPYGTTNLQLTLTGNLGNWTPGAPGAPDFSFDAGSKQSQSVQSSNSCLVTYTSPWTLGVVTITDPLNSLTCELTVDDASSECCQDLLDRVGEPDVGESLTSMLKDVQQKISLDDLDLPGDTTITEYSEVDYTTDVGTIHHAVTEIHQTTTQTQGGVPDLLLSLMVFLGQVRNLEIDTNLVVHNMETLAHYTLLDVIDYIRGASPITNTNLWDYLHDLRTVSGYTLGDILLAIANLKGIDDRDLTEVYNHITDAVGTDLDDVLVILNQLTANNTQDLQDVLTAIAAIPTNPITDLTPVLTETAAILVAIALLDSSMDSWFETIRDNAEYGLHAIKDELEEVHSQITDVPAGMQHKLDDILAAIAAIPTATPALVPPIWPGIANVTLGTPVAISAGFTVAGPLDGLLIEISYVPPLTGRYLFDGVPSYTHIGQVAFVSDNGDYEYPQNLGFQNQLVTPKLMVRAQSAVVRAKQAVTGTVTPWTIN